MGFWKNIFGGGTRDGARKDRPVLDEALLQSRGFTPEESRQMMQQLLQIEKYKNEPSIISESRIDINSEEMLKMGFFKEQDLKKYVKGAFNVQNALVALWTQASNDRRTYIKMATELRKFYIVKAILNLIAQDVLNANEEGEIVVISSDDSKIDKELKELQESIDFNRLLRDIIRDLIDFGEYAIRLKVQDGKGIVSYYDDVDVANFIALYDQGVPVNYMLYDNRELKVFPAHEYAHFVLGDDGKYRISIQDQFAMWQIPDPSRTIPDEIKDQLPDFIRIGEPLFAGMVQKLRELQLLEQLIPATKLNQITQTQMVAMKVPAGMSPEKVMESLRRYEQALNVPVGLNLDQEQITLAEVMTVTGKVRVVPNFSDEKGSLEPLNVRQNPPVDDILNSVKDIRAVLLTSIGVPPSLLFGSSDADKVNELRLFSRYTRRLMSIQRSLADGIKQICLTHLINKNIDCTAKDITVLFKQSLMDLSGLEKLEFDSAKQARISEQIEFVNKIFSNPLLNHAADHVELLNWLTESFDILTNGRPLFKKTNARKLVEIPDQFMMMSQDDNTPASDTDKEKKDDRGDNVTLDQ